ncbi:hypothetical protein H2202_002444 [Exophiala xenobiotica]|nr:hypothetical protein H2202_002444 [Exophiala xenobiotica]
MALSDRLRHDFETRHRWHKINWEEFDKDLSTINLPQPDWLYVNDTEKYTYEWGNDVVEHLTNGPSSRPTPIPGIFTKIGL